MKLNLRFATGVLVGGMLSVCAAVAGYDRYKDPSIKDPPRELAMESYSMRIEVNPLEYLAEASYQYRAPQLPIGAVVSPYIEFYFNEQLLCRPQECQGVRGVQFDDVRATFNDIAVTPFFGKSEGSRTAFALRMLPALTSNQAATLALHYKATGNLWPQDSYIRIPLNAPFASPVNNFRATISMSGRLRDLFFKAQPKVIFADINDVIQKEEKIDFDTRVEQSIAGKAVTVNISLPSNVTIPKDAVVIADLMMRD